MSVLTRRRPRQETQPVNDSRFQPMRLAAVPDAFDHPDFIFELKYDGFRAVAHADRGEDVRLVSRNGHRYKIFPRLHCAIAEALNGRDAVLDGEIVCFGADGRPRFYELLRRRGRQHFCAFDLLRLDGRDLRHQPLLERKVLLQSLIPAQPCAVVYVDYVEERGTALFEACCRLDLEGIVAKHREGPYAMEGPFRREHERTSWAKIRNRSYSQGEGRRELFRKRSA
jgi:bifunctional non-homologous end joining protein LigD